MSQLKYYTTYRIDDRIFIRGYHITPQDFSPEGRLIIENLDYDDEEVTQEELDNFPVVVWPMKEDSDNCS